MATDDRVEDFLAHHGVKGMHWGVRKERDSGEQDVSPESTSFPISPKHLASSLSAKDISSIDRGISVLNANDKAVLKAAGMSPLQAESMRAKYGPESIKPDGGKKGLSEGQKKLIVYGAIGLGVAGLVAYGIHSENAGVINSLIKDGGYEKDAAKAFLKENPTHAKHLAGMLSAGVKKPSAEYLLASDIQKATNAGKGLSPETLAKFSREDLDFDTGHVFKRVSMAAEKEIRPSGFFASVSDEDTDRYKAVLPVYWKIWDPMTQPDSGFVNHYQASTALKVANEGTVYDMMKNSMDDVIGGKTLRLRLKYATGLLNGTDEELLAKGFYPTVADFTNPEDKVVAHLSKKFLASGYHGIVDSNDAGSLSAKPVKFLTGGPFKIVANEALSANDITNAQDAIQSLVHFLSRIIGGEMNEDVEEFFEHFGIKGMHWGVHKDRSDRSVEDIQKDIKRFEKKRGVKTPGSLVIAGAGVRAQAAKRVLNLKQVKGPHGDTRLVETAKTPKVTKENEDKIDKKIDRAAYRHHTLVGTIAVTALLGTAVIAKASIKDPQLSDLVTKGALALAGLQAIQTASVTAGIHANVKLRGQQKKSSILEQELRTAQKKSLPSKS